MTVHQHTCGLISRRESVRLLEGDLPGNVNVKEVNLSMLADHRSVLVKGQARVVQLIPILLC